MLPLMGLVMAMALLGGVFSVDMGLIYDGREQARMAADMAALAGVQELPASEANALARAREYAALNGFDDCADGDQGAAGCDPNVTVTVTVMSGVNYDPIACLREGYCINVEVTREWQWLFGGLLQLPPVTITAAAVSQLGAQPRDVMVVLDTSGSMCDDSGRGSPGYCQDASKASLVGLDMTGPGSGNTINFGAQLSTLSGMNVPFVLPPGASTYSFTINGTPFTYSGSSTLNGIRDAINAQSAATSVTASLSSTGNNHTLTLTKTLFGVAPTIAIDDVEPGNFFRATRMLGDPQPTKLAGNDVDSAQNTVNYPADLGVILTNLNSISANFDVDFANAAGTDQFCIKASGHVDPLGDPCTAGTGTVITYDPSVDTMTAVLNRINSTAAAGVCATFAADVFTLTRGAMSGATCTPTLGPVAITVADLNGNFFQAVKLLQVPTASTAVGVDIADCVGPPSGTDSGTCFDTDDLGGAPANTLLSALNDELAVDLVPGAGSFIVNGCTIPYNTATESMNTITARITTLTAGGCSSGSGGPVTATVQVGSDTFLLTSTNLGNQPITYSDVVTNNGTGNFLQAMKFITPIRRTELRGQDVEGSIGTGFDTSDLTVQLRDLDGELQVDFERGSNLTFCINANGGACTGTGGANGVTVTYNAPASGSGSTLQSILDDINNPARAGGATGVIASIDTTTDQLLLRRNAYGNTPISVADLTGNFLHAMQLLGGSYSRVTGLDVADCNGGNGNDSPCDINASGQSGSDTGENLQDLNEDLTVNIVPTTNGQLQINGHSIFYNTATDSIDDVIARINDPANLTGVTASFVSSNANSATQDRFTLLQNTPGAVDITFADISGNFFQAMRLLAGGSNESITGGDVGDLETTNNDGDTDNLNTLNSFMTVDFAPVTNGRFLINDVAIDYNATTDEIRDVFARIDASAAGVTASFDYADSCDCMTLTRNAPGNTPITFSDITGNFLAAMQFYSGGSATTAVGADVGDLSAGNVGANLVTLTGAQITVPFNMPAGNAGSFFINGKLISYDIDVDTLQEVMDRITADVDAAVTATFNTTTDRLTLTRKAPGNLDITFSDNVGNFLHVFQFVSGSQTRWVGLDVADCLDDGGGNACNIDPAGGNGSETDEPLNAPGDTLNEDMTVDFLPVANGSFTINGQTITYDATTDSINSVIGRINDPLNETGVLALFDTNTDRLTLQSLASGPATITIVDGPGSNFFQAMRLLSPTTYSSVTGLDVASCNNCDIGDAERTSNLTGGTPNGDMTVDFVDVSNGEFTINGTSITYDTAVDSINSVIDKINLQVPDMTASFDNATDQLTLSRNTPGPLLITFADVTGNFLQAMRLLSATGTQTTIVGKDVADCGSCDIGSGEASDTLSGGTPNGDMTIDFDTAAIGNNGSLTVTPAGGGGGTVLYTTGDSINSVVADINALPGISASFSTTTDRLTITRDAFGPGAITLTDNVGNFLQAMRVIEVTPGTGTPSTVTGGDFSSCGGCTSFDDPADLGVTLPNLADELNVPFQLSTTSQFTINGVAINFDANTATLNSLKALIDGSAAGVTATFSGANDNLTLTADGPGAAPITFADVNGNFMEAMGMISGGTRVSLEGQDFADCTIPDPTSCFDATDYDSGADTLATLDDELQVSFIAPGSFSINGTTLNYTAASTLGTIVTSINASGAGVVATIDSSTDRLRLTRTAPGAQAPITIADITGNFFQAMRFTAGAAYRVTGIDVGDLEGSVSPASGDFNVALNTMNGVMDRDFHTVSNGRFTINGTAITWAATETLSTVLTRINSSGADVVATFDTSDLVDKLTLTRVSPANWTTPITLDDNVGNFLHAMGLAGAKRYLEGVDVADCGGCDIVASDLDSDVAGGTPDGDLTVDFQDVNGSFTINGVTITYNGLSGGDSINDIMGMINASAAGVIATFDTTSDRLRLTRTAAGTTAAITIADVTGNFFQAMRMLGAPTSVSPTLQSTTQTLVGSNTTAPVFSMPTPRPDGDLYVAVVYSSSSFGSPTIPGWTKLDGTGGRPNLFANDGASVAIGAWYRIGASEPGSYMGSSFPSTEYVIHVLRISNFGTTDPFDVGSAQNGNSTFANAPGATPGTTGGLMFRAWAIDEDNPTVPALGGHTFRGGSSSSAGGGGSVYGTVATLNAMTTSGSAVSAATLPGGGNGGTQYNDNWAAMTFVVNPQVSQSLLAGVVSVDGTTVWPDCPSGTPLCLTKVPGSAPSSIATPTTGVAGTPVVGTPGTNPTVTYVEFVTDGTAAGGPLAGITTVIGVLGGAHLGTETPGVAGLSPAPEDSNCRNLPGSDVVTVPGDVLCGNAVTPSVTTVSGADPTAVPVLMGVDQVVAPTPGVVPPLPLNNPCPAFTSQCRIAVVTPGLDASDLRGDLQIGDIEAIGHLIASFTLSNHRPLADWDAGTGQWLNGVDFWRPFGEVQRAASRFSRLPVFAPDFDQMGLVGFADTAGIPDLVFPPTDPVHECETAAGAPPVYTAIPGCRVPNAPLGHGFGVPVGGGFSSFELELLELQAEGSTNTGGGLCVALNDLRNPALGHGLPGADKIIVLLSDGAPTAVGQPGCPTVGTAAVANCSAYAQNGNVPGGQYEYTRYLACLAREAQVTIHTIGLSLANATDTQLMQDVASITGGQYFDAATAGDLAQQFENVANILGTALTR